MENIIYKIKAYAKSKSVNDINFQSDVIVVKPSDEDSKIQAWNLDIPKPTADELNSFEDEANTMKAEDDAKPTRADLKASAKAKLMAGEALTEDEANTIVL
tara:strand:- start:5821 stop:6123 length:303 start_codon:yes stop_codon:yes gene_type:complete